jgi:hypothetical protein
MRFVSSTATVAVIAALATVVPALAQAPAAAGATWTFSTDSANNLVIQDVEAFSAAQVRPGAALCLQYYPDCPSNFDLRASDLRLARPRYTLRGNGGKDTDWRIDVGQPTIRSTGATLPFLVGGVEQGSVQIVSSPGPWSVDLQRIPAAELRVGDGKRWNVFLTLSEAPPDAASCWVEVACPTG